MTGSYVCLPNSLLGTHQVPSALLGRGGMCFLWAAWHCGGDLWHDPILYKGGGGQRPPLRRHLQNGCFDPGCHVWMGRLVGLEPPLPSSVRGLTKHRCVPPMLGGGGLSTLSVKVQAAAAVADL